MDLRLAGKKCLVTGASRGIGLETARTLAAEGASVLLVARGEEDLGRAVQLCEGPGLITGATLDVTHPRIGELVTQIPGFDEIDVLINNAGTTAARPLAKLEEGDWQAQWELHVLAPMRLMRALAPGMSERGWGRIVNVSSSAGKRPSSTNMAYTVTKAAALSLSRSFADLYARRGVLINAVAPGPVATELWMAPGGMADQVGRVQGTTREEALGSYRAKVPLGRFADATEIANVIVFLASELASNVVGAAWSVDGGAVSVII